MVSNSVLENSSMATLLSTTFCIAHSVTLDFTTLALMLTPQSSSFILSGSLSLTTIQVYLFDPHSITIECRLECLCEESLWCLNMLHGDLLRPKNGDLSMDARGLGDDHHFRHNVVSVIIGHRQDAQKGISTLSYALTQKLEHIIIG